MDKLKCLLHIATLSYKTNATYKQSNLFGIIVNSFWLIIQMYILVAFIKHGISSYTVQQGVGYVVLTEALLTITGLSGSLGGIDIDDLIKSVTLSAWKLDACCIICSGASCRFFLLEWLR